MARQFGPSYAEAVSRASVPFLWLCGPCRLRATPERLTERVFRRGLGRGPVIPGPPPTTSRQRLAAMAAEATREAGELDAADFADLCIDTDNRNVAQVAKHIRRRTGGWPVLTP